MLSLVLESPNMGPIARVTLLMAPVFLFCYSHCFPTLGPVQTKKNVFQSLGQNDDRESENAPSYLI